MPSTTPSTITPQTLIDYARLYPWTVAATGVGGYSDQPALSFANDIAQLIMSKANPWKWNSNPISPIYTQPYQQDYPINVSQNLMGWLESGTLIDINNQSRPIPQTPIRAVSRLLPTNTCAIPKECCWVPNEIAQFSTWPGNNQVYTNPLSSLGGGPASNPRTAILDPNGNIQLVTTYGTTISSSIPSWPAANAAAGTTTSDGTVVWTVQDPNGVSIRLNALATNNSQVWSINLVYQEKPPVISTLGQTFAPIPDDLGYLIRQGFLTFCTRIADSKKFQEQYVQWLADIQDALMGSDREPQEFSIYPANSLQGKSSSWNYPGWPGWTNNDGGY